MSGSAAALLVAAVAACFWPGVAMYDTVAQYGQVLSGDVDDWHPPVMVRLWQLVHPLSNGTAPMFVLQCALYAAGLGLIVAALARSRRSIAAFGAATVGLSPLLLGWQMVVLKDAQMLGALLAALGIAAHFRLARRRIPLWAAVVISVLLVYATLVRVNAVFVTVPLAILLFRGAKRPLASTALAFAATAVVLAVTPLINDSLLGAARSDVAKTQPIFDLAAIAVAVPNSASPFTPDERRQIAARHCVKAFFWDPLGEPSACAPAAERLMTRPTGELYMDLARAAASHPLAYAEHRLKHWNSTERWLVAPGLPDAAPPVEVEPNDVGLGTPTSAVASPWQDIAAVEAATPFGWPIVWTALALCLLPLAWRRRAEAQGEVALALLVSALLLEASFLVVSIASDLRYHLWPMTASALALVLLSDDLRLKHGRALAAAALLSAVVGGGIYTRWSLPPAPDSYQSMIHAASG